MDQFLGRNDGQMQCRGILHVVEAGDTLYKIGKKHGVPVSRIMYANPYVNVYNLQVGDEICVPVMVPRMREDNPMTPARDNHMENSRMPAHRDYTEDNRMPAHRDYMEDTRMPAQENRGFPLTPLRVITVDDGNGETNSTNMAKGMDSAEEGSMQDPAREDAAKRRNMQAPVHENVAKGRNMRDAARENVAKGRNMRDAAREDAVKERGTLNQEDMDNAREYAPAADGCVEKGHNCLGMRTPKVLPWDDTEVSKQMMDDYLQG